MWRRQRKALMATPADEEELSQAAERVGGGDVEAEGRDRE